MKGFFLLQVQEEWVLKDLALEDQWASNPWKDLVVQVDLAV
jgi:hypothetical protein